MCSRAQAIDPLDPLVHAHVVAGRLPGRRLCSALEQAQLAIGLDAEFWIGHVMRGQALLQLASSIKRSRR